MLKPIVDEPVLSPPADFGLPEQFEAWRPGQDVAVLHCMEATERHIGSVLPTGFGKSLVYMAVALLTGVKTVLLTATKALQQQIWADFKDVPGTVLVQGQSNYECVALRPGNVLSGYYGRTTHPVMVDQAPCHLGVECTLKLGGCTYYDTLREAERARLVVTNYAFWLTLYERRDIRLSPKLLILDEAHAAPDALTGALGADISFEDVQEFLGEELMRAEQQTTTQWVNWARVHHDHLSARTEGTKPTNQTAARNLRRIQMLMRHLERISKIEPHLLAVSNTRHGVKFDIIWAATFAEARLFQHVPRTILTSATFTLHTAELLGIAPKDISMYEAGDGFPKQRRPVYILPAILFGLKPIRVDYQMTPVETKAWVEHIDCIIDGRLDRNGVIHTISYTRRDILIAHSRHAARMMTHGSRDAQEKIAQFKRAKKGTVLVSPSVTTGYDFPLGECEYQIIAKIPFPDKRDPVTAARAAIDPRYPNHVAMQQLVQMVGRGMRAEEDQCETFIVDDHARWFLGKKYLDLAPRWFKRAIVRGQTTIPVPPPPLSSAA